MDNFNIGWLDSTPSTNDFMKENLKSDVGQSWGDFTVSAAKEQSLGRGYGENKWESIPNKNLTFSVLLCPEFLSPEKQFYISKVVSLGLVKALSEYMGSLSIKWPNDIYYKDKKIAGILIENSLRGANLINSIVGIGLNVNQTTFYSDAPNPISMANICGGDFNLDNVLIELLREIELYYTELKAGLFDKLDLRYLDLLYKKGEVCRFVKGDKDLEARILGVNEFGNLMLEHETDGVIAYDFKEVELVI